MVDLVQYGGMDYIGIRVYVLLQKGRSQVSQRAYIIMQQRKLGRSKRQSKASFASSHLPSRLSTLAANRSQDIPKSKLHSPRDSYLRQFRKPKLKLNSLSSIGNINIQQQIKTQLSQVQQLLLECKRKAEEHKMVRNEKQEMIQLQQMIRGKDETIKSLTMEIQALKKHDNRVINQEDSQSSGNRGTDSSDKERIFKLAEEMREQRREMVKNMAEHQSKYNNYQKIKKLIEQIEQKYTQKHNKRIHKDQSYRGPPLITYEQYKQKIKTQKQANIQAKAKRVDFYHHLSPEKQANPSMNMKDLITRKNITMTALKNSKKKHIVEMEEYIAKLDFLKDEDQHLNQKIKEKTEELRNMEQKFSEKKGEKQKIENNAVYQFHANRSHLRV